MSSPGEKEQVPKVETPEVPPSGSKPVAVPTLAGKRTRSPKRSALGSNSNEAGSTSGNSGAKLGEAMSEAGGRSSSSVEPQISPRRPVRAPFVRQRSQDSSENSVLESSTDDEEFEEFDGTDSGEEGDLLKPMAKLSVANQSQGESGSSTPSENVQVIEKGMRPLERKLSRTISQTWNAIDEHEEMKANKVDHSGLQNVLQRRLSQLPVRQSRLQVLADGSRDTKFVVDDDYDGPKLPAPPALPTQDHLQKMIAAFRQSKLLHYRYAHELVGRVTAIHRDQNLNIQRIQFPPEARLTIVGDLHGQLQDLLAILEFQGLPSPTNWYLFNGDFVDRGSHSIEVLWIIYVFKLMYPDFIWLNRGNHEHRLLNKRYKFERQVKMAYDERLYERVALSFDVLPLCTIINKDVFVVHGGLTEFSDLTLQDIEKIPFNREVPRDIFTKSDRIMKQLVWSDPWTAGEDREEPSIRTHGWAENSRGAGILWAPSITMKFLEKNRLRLIIRSHQMVDEGFKYHHSHHVVTLFSASYYCGKNENRGAIAVFENGSTRSIKYIQYCADPLAAQRTPEDEADMAQRTVKQTLQKLAETIYHKRYKLLMGFSKLDTDLDGTISVDDWVKVLESVIKINLRWHDLWIELFAPKTSPRDTKNPIGSSSSPITTPAAAPTTLRWREFLERFSLALDSKMLRLWNHQQEFVAANVCTKILAKYGDLKSAFDTIKGEKTKILCADFCQLLLDSELGLSRNAACDFTSSIDIDKDGSISYEEFFKRFRKQFGIAAAKPEVSKFVRQLGDAIYSNKPTQQKKALLQGAWTTLPKTPEGFVDMDGFGEVLKRLRVDCDPEIKKGVFDYLNSSGSGQISEQEFRKAFAFRALESNAVLRVFTLVQKYSHDLGIAFVSADSLGNGVVDEEEFISAVSSVLEVKNILDVPETDISSLFEAIVDEDSENLHYHSAMSSFRITFK
jgi:diadenosine tetraphosphatase ApaH/serine/threonine PP2A family protein phosphatase/Ca2+-binding EF-hand superfamily protein